jgi:hypothetical protein
MNEIIVCSETQQVPLLICWRKSKCYLLGGWRLQMLPLLLIIILGGRTHCSIWASTNVFYFAFVLLYCYRCNTIVVLLGTPWAEKTTWFLFHLYIYIYTLQKDISWLNWRDSKQQRERKKKQLLFYLYILGHTSLPNTSQTGLLTPSPFYTLNHFQIF